MTDQTTLDLLVRTILGAVQTPRSCAILVQSVRAGSWADIVPNDAAYKEAVWMVVTAADGQGWLRDLVLRLTTEYPTRPEFNKVLASLDAVNANPAPAEPLVPQIPFAPRLPTPPPYRWQVVLRFLSAQKKFYIGLVVSLGLLALFVFLVRDDELAIRTLDERGQRVNYVNLEYDARKPDRAAPGGLKILENTDDEGFYRIMHSEIAEPPQINLVLDDSKLPPQLAGNSTDSILRVVKINYEEGSRFSPWYKFKFLPWNRARKLFLYVAIQSAGATP